MLERRGLFLIGLVGIAPPHERMAPTLKHRANWTQERYVEMALDQRRQETDKVLEDEFLLTAILNRRSISRVSEEEPPEHLIRTMLKAATWAPNHHLTEPWRFFVFRGDARARLGEVMGDAAARREEDADKASAARSRMLQKPLRAPYVIAVAAEPDARDKVFEIEEIAATAAATQNLLLAAEALGLGAIWRTGWVAYSNEIRDYLGLSSRATVLGFVYVGYTALPPAARTRKPADAVTTWM